MCLEPTCHQYTRLHNAYRLRRLDASRAGFTRLITNLTWTSFDSVCINFCLRSVSLVLLLLFLVPFTDYFDCSIFKILYRFPAISVGSITEPSDQENPLIWVWVIFIDDVGDLIQLLLWHFQTTMDKTREQWEGRGLNHSPRGSGFDRIAGTGVLWLIRVRGAWGLAAVRNNKRNSRSSSISSLCVRHSMGGYITIGNFQCKTKFVRDLFVLRCSILLWSEATSYNNCL